jgi:hypothetical protein
MITMRTRAIAITAAAAASLVMTGAGMASASPHPSAAKTATEYIQEMSTSATSPVSQVIAYGDFTASGTDTAISNGSDRLAFPGGAFIATYKAIAVHQRTDPGTCASTVVLTLAYKLSKGTGKFAGITGSGRATVTILTLAATAHGKCSATVDVAQQTLIQASGPVTLK